MPNLFSKRNAEELSLNAQNLLELVPAPPAPNGLGMTAAQRANLKTVSDRIVAAIQAKKTADQMVRQATIEKGYARDAMIYEMNAIAQAAYGSGIPDQTLAGYGFAPQRSAAVRPVPPLQVTGLVAEPFADGTVRLSWDRSGNRDSTTFLVERSADGVAWTQIGATGAVKVTIDGFAPGVGTWFRVVAKNSVGTAVPSAMESIYNPSVSAAPNLRVA